MKFGLAVIGDIDENKSNLIIEFSNEMKNHFKEKNYGNDIKSLTIGVICVSPQFEMFFKEKKPRYIKGKKETIQEGIPFTLEDDFEYDIKLGFEDFKKVTESEAKKILAINILKSIYLIDVFKSKIHDFDNDVFKKDLKEYFKSKYNI
jgi:hypothetical protein